MTNPSSVPQYIAFALGKRIAQGSQAEIAAQLALSESPALVFDNRSGEQIELPIGVAASPNELAQLLPSQPPSQLAPPPAPQPNARPGRPKLGVIAREVTLLPHDWEWLGEQPGGASAAIRKLVLAARRSNAGADAVRQAQKACYRFIHAIAGDAPGFEEATRALFAGNLLSFNQHTETWPNDVRDHARLLASTAFAGAAKAPI